MSAASLLLVVATVISVEAGTAHLDRGRTDGLEPGDRGRIYYQLTVAGQPRRIEVGSASITAVEASTATLAIPAGLTIHPGYRIEVEIPASRLQRSVDEEPAKRPAPAPVLIPVLREKAGEEPVEKPVAPTTPPDMVLIPAGRYAVGLDLAEAEFFSQTPRFTVDLPPFWIDREPTSRRNLTYAQAEAYCREEGRRLPTEIEWEIAMQQNGVGARPGLLEWTASWYEPYPGNRRPEEQYGHKFRVLRGSPSTATPDPHVRRYLAPGDRNPGVGFRCALDQL